MIQKNIIVTHANPDLDAITAVWLIKRFWNGWESAETLFVPAGETIESYKKKAKDAYLYEGDLDAAAIVHVDTGMGSLDHHQSNEDTCAARLVLDTMLEARTMHKKKGKYLLDGIAIETRHFDEVVLLRLTHEVNEIDHFRQVFFPEPAADRYQFMLADILDGLNLLYNTTGSGDVQVLSHGMSALDGIYRVLQNKKGAEEEMEKSDKTEVATRYGKAVGFETGNDAVLDIAQKLGYPIAARKDKRKGYVRIKSLPGKNIDLAPLGKVLEKKDPMATWFLHASHAMLLNGSTKNPTMRPSTLSLGEIMEEIRQLYR